MNYVLIQYTVQNAIDGQMKRVAIITLEAKDIWTQRVQHHKQTGKIMMPMIPSAKNYSLYWRIKRQTVVKISFVMSALYCPLVAKVNPPECQLNCSKKWWCTNCLVLGWVFFFYILFYKSVCYDFVFIQHNTVESRVSKTNVFFLLFFLNGVFWGRWNGLMPFSFKSVRKDDMIIFSCNCGQGQIQLINQDRILVWGLNCNGCNHWGLT